MHFLVFLASKYDYICLNISQHIQHVWVVNSVAMYHGTNEKKNEKSPNFGVRIALKLHFLVFLGPEYVKYT